MYIRQWVEVGGIPYPEIGYDDEEPCELEDEDQEQADYWFNFDSFPEEYLDWYFYWLQ